MATPWAPAGLRQLPQTLQCGAAAAHARQIGGYRPAAGRYVETHEFYFDEVFDERVRNEEALTPASWPAGRRPPAPPRPCVTAAARALKQTIGTRRHSAGTNASGARAVQVYRRTAQPLVGSIFNGGKATCFAYAVAAA